MAEIKIEKKQKPVWPWIIGALLVVLAIILIFGNGWQEKAEEATVTKATEDAPQVPEEVNEYIAYIRETEPTEDMSLHHEYTAEGIQRLASALDALVNETDAEDIEINEKKQQLRQNANYIQQDPYSATHADSIKSAFDVASDIIVSVQQQNFPELSSEAQNVRSAAQNIDTQTLTLNQKEDVRNFFEESASALDAMARHINGNGNNRQ